MIKKEVLKMEKNILSKFYLIEEICCYYVNIKFNGVESESFIRDNYMW